MRLPGLKPQLNTYLNTYMNSEIQHVCNNKYSKNIKQQSKRIRNTSCNMAPVYKARCLIKLARLKMHTALPHASCPEAILNKSRTRFKKTVGGVFWAEARNSEYRIEVRVGRQNSMVQGALWARWMCRTFFLTSLSDETQHTFHCEDHVRYECWVGGWNNYCKWEEKNTLGSGLA